MGTTGKHSEYKGDIIRYKQMKDDEVQIAQEIKDKQNDLLEAEKERIGNENAEDGVGIDQLMADYAKTDKYKEYLVDGAVLKCTQATCNAFKVSDDKTIHLVIDSDEDEEDRKRTILHVYENPVYINDLKYATVGNTIKYQNIAPFRCNCLLPVDREEERKEILADAESSEYGVCRHLMELSDKWDNALIEGTSYEERKRAVGVGSAGAVLAVSPMTVEEEGITMTSVLFCRHGGIIYPETSGQMTEEKEDIFSELEKDLLKRFYTDLAYENWTDDKKKCAQEIWNKFYVECGYDVNFVAGLIGNMYGEASCGMLQSYQCDWSKYSSSLKGYMIISNIEQARIACLMAPDGYGIGAIQWSTKDRKKLLYRNYQLSQLEDGSLPTNQLIEAELNTIYDELNGDFSDVYEAYLRDQNIDEAGDSIFLSTCIIFRDYEIPASYKDVDKQNGYILATGVEDKAKKAQSIDKVPSIIQRIIAAKVAYEVFTE